MQNNAELNRYRAGELHTTSPCPPDAFAWGREEDGAELRGAPYRGVYYYGYNMTMPPLMDNAALRLALSLAIYC